MFLLGTGCLEVERRNFAIASSYRPGLFPVQGSEEKPIGDCARAWRLSISWDTQIKSIP
jgi:hypothetical protein